MPFEPENDSSTEEIAKLKKRLAGFETVEGRSKGLAYKPRRNDVAISTSPKAGTTWMQQICHQLRSADTGGDMEFDEISRVVPWIELAIDQGQDLESPQYGESDGKPRLFKTHCWAGHCPSFSKTIVVVRDPYDVVVSFYKFFEDWFFESGSIPLDHFAKEFWLARGVPESPMENASYFVHLVSWYERRQETDRVLFVFFEDMKEDLESQVRRVAKFISNDQHDFTKDQIIKVATERSSFKFMRENADHFNEQISKLTRNEACGLPKDAGMKKGKVASGNSGAGKALLDDELMALVDEKWKAVVTPATNCLSYSELRKQFSSSNKIDTMIAT